jgi:5-methylcytosine-specific restriction endonuclease McrA
MGVIIGRKYVEGKGYVQLSLDYDKNLKGKYKKSCITCGEYKELEEFINTINLGNKLFNNMEHISDDCIECILEKNNDFPKLPDYKFEIDIISSYHDFKRCFVKANEFNSRIKSDFQLWEFKVANECYLLTIKDKKDEVYFPIPFKKMQGKESTRSCAYNYYRDKYGADLATNIAFLTICSYNPYRQKPLVCRNYKFGEYLGFIPDESLSLYHVDMEIVKRDIQADMLENSEDRVEGAIKEYFGKRYERDPINRKRALELHGLSCVVCEFNFEEIYGERGKDFIEVHHVKPLSTLGGNEEQIDPRTDLVPVCSNCHRMIHRRHDDVLSIEQMKSILTSRGEGKQ